MKFKICMECLPEMSSPYIISYLGSLVVKPSPGNQELLDSYLIRGMEFHFQMFENSTTMIGWNIGDIIGP
jgi:hypothetical protein